jgi:hypothetical protein
MQHALARLAQASRPMNRLWFGVIFVAACSSSGRPAAAPDGGGDDAGAVEPDATSDASNDAACGAPPYVNVGLVVRSAAASGANGAPVEGAKLTASICPGVQRVSAADGTVSAQISRGVPFYPRFEAENYAPTVIGEMHFDVDKTGIVVPLPPQLFVALVPDFGPDKTAIVLGVMKDGGSGACDQLDGVALQVLNHPEAKVLYFSDDAIPQPTTGTVTTAAGRATITGLAPDQFVSVQATKAGCAVVFDKDPYTGRAPLAAGTLTLVAAYLHN